jgi:ABC-2 type transport system ATP-binding protein
MAEQSKAVVQVKGLHKSYGDVHALRGLDLEVGAGQILGFLGPNGAGKTTAIKIISGFIAADSGSASVCGFDCESQSLDVKQVLGYLPENNPLYLEMRVVDALGFIAAAHGLSGVQRKDAIDRVVEQTQLQEVYWRQLRYCSKGFRQRVGLAQALLNDPQVLLLDEPTNGLDPLQVVEMRKLISGLRASKTVMITSHVLSEIEAVADRVVVLDNGVKVMDKNISDLADEQLLAVEFCCTEDKLREICQQAHATVEQIVEASKAGRCQALVKANNLAPELVANLAKAAVALNVDVAMLSPRGHSLEHEFRKICHDNGGKE